jgi:hypothetical protein
MGIFQHWSFLKDTCQNVLVQTVGSITLRWVVERERLLRMDVGLLDITISGLCSVGGFSIGDAGPTHSGTTG